MFTVNKEIGARQKMLFAFQNISCLRLISPMIDGTHKTGLFQNISCLRLIKKGYNLNVRLYKFQNISCLRLI